MPIKNLQGKRFGKLVVIQQASERRWRKICWLCLCDCGREKILPSSYLTSGDTKSCGCWTKELIGKRNSTHGMSKTRIYSIWCNMKKRCQDPLSTDYEIYGGRGIKVCDRWQTFEGFLEDMGSGYQEGLSIERVDVNGNYESSNCCWATMRKQQNNRRNNRRITYKGRTKTLIEWARYFKIHRKTLSFRLKNWPLEKAFRTPVGSKV